MTTRMNARIWQKDEATQRIELLSTSRSPKASESHKKAELVVAKFLRSPMAPPQGDDMRAANHAAEAAEHVAPGMTLLSFQMLLVPEGPLAMNAAVTLTMTFPVHVSGYSEFTTGGRSRHLSCCPQGAVSCWLSCRPSRLTTLPFS